MEYFSKLWTTSNANQVSSPITKQDDTRLRLIKHPIKKPDAYKSINTSQIKIITGKNPDNI